MSNSNIYKHAAEVAMISFVFFTTTSMIEDSTQIRGQYPTTWYFARFLIFFALITLYNKYRRPQLSQGLPKDQPTAMGEEKAPRGPLTFLRNVFCVPWPTGKQSDVEGQDVG